MTDPYDLQRFVAAQEQTYDRAAEELRRGRKTSHWMWFVFPQVEGLGRSPMAQRYAIADLDEARAYLDHPVLGARLRECASLLLRLAAADVDAVKLRSSMTLFAEAGRPDDPFRQVLDDYFGGRPDEATLERLPRP